MAVKISNSGMTAAYIGASAVTSMYIGEDIIYPYSLVAAVRAENIGGTIQDFASATTMVNPKSTDFKIRLEGSFVGDLGLYLTAYIFKASNGSLIYASEFENDGFWFIYDDTSSTEPTDIPYVRNFDVSSGTTFDLTMANNYIYDNLTDITLAQGTRVSETTTADTGNIVLFFNTLELSRVRMWKDDVLVFDGKAAKRNDGQGGLFDSISGEFYTDNNKRILTIE